MTTIKRWSSPDSDVDPVLRSLMRYARDCGPSSDQTQTLLLRLDDDERVGIRRICTWRTSRSNVARRISLVTALVFGIGGMAWAGLANLRSLASQPHAIAEGRGSKRQYAAPVLSKPTQLVTPSPSTSVAPSTIPEVPIEPKPSPQRLIKDVGIDVSDEAELLSLARAALYGKPYRALVLAQQHAKRFPISELTEERTALQIEALQRLGRIVEATRAREDFELRFPASPYRRRLQALTE
jgi:hypothetical protein